MPLFLRLMSLRDLGRRDQSNLILKLMTRNGFVYFLTNKSNSVVYVGVTNDLKRRVYEHKSKLLEGFTKKYNLTKLVYYEIFNSIQDAIAREKQIKAGPRKRKVELIISMNSDFRDLYEEI